MDDGCATEDEAVAMRLGEGCQSGWGGSVISVATDLLPVFACNGSVFELH